MSSVLIHRDGTATVNGRRVPSTPEDIAAALREDMVVSRFQGRVALSRAGLLDAAEAAAVAAGGETLMAWQEALEWRRTSPTIAALAAALGLTDEQVDDLFRAAADIAL